MRHAGIQRHSISCPATPCRSVMVSCRVGEGCWAVCVRDGCGRGSLGLCLHTHSSLPQHWSSLHSDYFVFIVGTALPPRCVPGMSCTPVFREGSCSPRLLGKTPLSLSPFFVNLPNAKVNQYIFFRFSYWKLRSSLPPSARPSFRKLGTYFPHPERKYENTAKLLLIDYSNF